MSKRRINKQQSTRIQQQQTDYLNAATTQNSNAQEGLVITRFSRHALIEDSTGHLTSCSIRPNIDSLVAGDKVIWQTEGDIQGVIVSRFPRQSELCRPDKQNRMKPVAANITQLIIVMAAKPEVSWPLLDSYLVLAEYLGLRAIIVLNKTDLPCAADKATLEEVYKPLNYPIFYLNQNDSVAFTLFTQELDHQISVFVGQSGVGKSSIISSLLPHEESIQVGAISEQSELGRHTTSNSKFYHILVGGALIDSPGVREFGLWHMPPQELAKGYREFKPLISQCKFRNCDHEINPGCALLKAHAEGQIHSMRFTHYRKLCQQMNDLKSY